MLIEIFGSVYLRFKPYLIVDKTKIKMNDHAMLSWANKNNLIFFVIFFLIKKYLLSAI